MCIYTYIVYIYFNPPCLIQDTVTDAHRPPRAHGGRRHAHAVVREYQHARSIQAARVSTHQWQRRALPAAHARGSDCAHVYVYMHMCAYIYIYVVSNNTRLTQDINNTHSQQYMGVLAGLGEHKYTRDQNKSFLEQVNLR